MKSRALLLLLVSPLLALSAETNSSTAPSGADSSTPKISAGKDLFAGLPIFDLVKLDQAPVVKNRVPPQYPSSMLQAQIEGDVVVDFVVTSEGKVVNAVAIHSSRHDFEAAAVAAVNKWKFTPGTKGGRPVNTHMQAPIAFALN